MLKSKCSFDRPVAAMVQLQQLVKPGPPQRSPVLDSFHSFSTQVAKTLASRNEQQRECEQETLETDSCVCWSSMLSEEEDEETNNSQQRRSLSSSTASQLSDKHEHNAEDNNAQAQEHNSTNRFPVGIASVHDDAPSSRRFTHEQPFGPKEEVERIQDNDPLALASLTRPQDKHVNFGTVTIREYAVTLGDNPGGVAGPPLTLEWEPQAEYVFNVEEWLDTKIGIPHREGEDLRRSIQERTYLLRDYSYAEMNRVAVECRRIRVERFQSFRQCQRWHWCCWEHLASRRQKWVKKLSNPKKSC